MGEIFTRFVIDLSWSKVCGIVSEEIEDTVWTVTRCTGSGTGPPLSWGKWRFYPCKRTDIGIHILTHRGIAHIALSPLIFCLLVPALLAWPILYIKKRL